MKHWNILLHLLGTFIIAYSVSVDEVEFEDPELKIDVTKWKNPHDPLGSLGLSLAGSCNADEQVQKYKEIINQKDEEIQGLQHQLYHQSETFAKSLLSIILHSLGVNINKDDHVFLKADATLQQQSMNTVKRFLSDPSPSEAMKARLQGELEHFLSPAVEVREHKALTFLRQMLPFILGLDVLLIIFLLSYYNILRNKRVILMMIIFGLFIHEVSQKVNADYKKALAERMAREVRQRNNPCDPKGYLSAIGTYFGSIFTRIDDPCVEFYKDALSETSIDSKILSSAFYVVGEMVGSPFIGLANTMQSAIETYFSPAPLYIQWLKFGLLIFAMICGVAVVLRFWQVEIQSPLLTIRCRVGDGGAAQSIAHKYEIAELKNHWNSVLQKQLDIENAMDHFYVAALSGDTRLKQKCSSYIKANLMKVMASERFRQLDALQTKEILDDVMKPVEVSYPSDHDENEPVQSSTSALATSSDSGDADTVSATSPSVTLVE